jgi:type VI secretion system protein ImpM
MSADSEVTGWYGKLPSLGDFASRRLDAAFIEPWDDWLARGLAHWRERDPDGWLDAYLACPSWRFVLMPGCLQTGSGAWAGVLMPSVDRVGRYFPLTLVRRLRVLPGDAAQLDGLQRWLHRLDDLALDALNDDWSVEQLDAELLRLGHPAPAAAEAEPVPLAWPGAGAVADTRADAGVATLLSAAAAQGLHDALHGHALWLSDDGCSAPTFRLTNGLPAAEDFAGLLVRHRESTTPSTFQDPP